MNLNRITQLSEATEHAFAQLAHEAKQQDINLSIASGFRSVERQVAIWNRKSAPEYTFIIDGVPRKAATLSLEQWLKAVMEWSAVPGLSRHHWGTDIDVFDANALPHNYQLQLSPDEYASNGIFARLNRFLIDTIDNNPKGLFFRPYRSPSNGVSPEAWHLSLRSEAVNFIEQFTLEIAFNSVPYDKIYAGDLVKAQFESIYQHYVVNIDTP